MRTALIVLVGLSGCAAPTRELESRMEGRLTELRGELEREREARASEGKTAREELGALRKRLGGLAGIERELAAHRQGFQEATKLAARLEEVRTLTEQLDRELRSLQNLPTLRNDLRDAVAAAGMAKRKLAELDEALRTSALARVGALEARLAAAEKRLEILDRIRLATELGSEAVAEGRVLDVLSGRREIQGRLWYLPTEREWKAAALTAYANSREALSERFIRTRFILRPTAAGLEGFLTLEATAAWAKSYAGAGRWYVPDRTVVAAIEEACTPLARKIRRAFPEDELVLRIFLGKEPLAVWQKGAVRLVAR